MGAHGSKILSSWLVLNGVLDVVPLGFVPIFGGALPPGCPSLQEMLPAFGAEPDFRHRAVAFHFVTCGVLRILAGATNAPHYVRLAAFSYAMELFQFGTEVFKYKTTTFQAAAGAFVIPTLCIASIAAGVLDKKKSKQQGKQGKQGKGKGGGEKRQ